MNGYRFEITSNTALAFGNPVIGISPTDDPARLTIHHGASGRKNEGWITIVLPPGSNLIVDDERRGRALAVAAPPTSPPKPMSTDLS
jgi:hypothetical protein